jgi:hypothetical protein
MTQAKQKAIEIYEGFFYILPASLSSKQQDAIAKKCSLFSIAEIKKVVKEVDELITNYEEEILLWQEVESEIKKL